MTERHVNLVLDFTVNRFVDDAFFELIAELVESLK